MRNWEANYRSMNYEQLQAEVRRLMSDRYQVAHDKQDRLVYLCREMAIKSPWRDNEAVR